MSKDPKEYLKHIRDKCSYIISVIGNNVSYEEFVQNETLKRAVVRSIEVIGEATKKIPSDFKSRWTCVE